MGSILIVLAAMLILAVSIGLPAFVIASGVRGLNNWTDEVMTKRGYVWKDGAGFLKKDDPRLAT